MTINIPTLHTERLLLRPFAMEDAEAYAQHVFSVEEVMRYMSASGAMPLNPLRTARDYIVERNDQWQQMGFGAWAVVEKATDTFMGHAGLFVIEKTDVIEVGYTLGKRFWGKGYATEAAREVLRYGFHVKEMTEIVAVAFPQNTASLRVMEKLGMRSQGITDQYYGLALACYTITRAQFDAAPPQQT